MEGEMCISANIVDVHNRRVFPGKLSIENGKIVSIEETGKKLDTYIVPGFVDAHIHIESSMVTPVAFSRAAIKHGTVATVSDPHEIANVLGMEGVEYMLENAKRSPMKFLFGAPSCVPATPFESSGAVINAAHVKKLLEREEVGYLSEVMNYPGVIGKDPEVLEKLKMARLMGLPIDGHAPGIVGEELKKYAIEGISTDHECFSYEEAVEKISNGMSILIREGSGAKNFEALIPLLLKYPEKVMFCSDDLHPDDLLKGHINVLVKRAVKAGYDLFDTLKASGVNAIKHYKMNVGMLRLNDPADFILIDSLEEWNVLSTYINGKAYFENGKVAFDQIKSHPINKFNISQLEQKELAVQVRTQKMNVITAIDGELITRMEQHKAMVVEGKAVSDISRDILKITVVNRYTQSPPAIAFIKGFGLKRGALASSIGHDSHNIICVGTSDGEMCDTINWIIRNKGGIAAHDGKKINGLALEVGGIMSAGTVENAANKYIEISRIAEECGSTLTAPLMTLAFMALLVIPEIKLSDKGLFDVRTFSFTSLFVDEE